jgi:translation initiation factor 5A
LLTESAQLDIGDDDFMSLMGEDGASKDDVKCPDNEIGAKIRKLFVDEEKDTSAYNLSQAALKTC